jgi:hypothetical protein
MQQLPGEQLTVQALQYMLPIGTQLPPQQSWEEVHAVQLSPHASCSFAPPHVPPQQTSVGPHVAPPIVAHAPQLASSVMGSTQVPLQQICPAAQTGEHPSHAEESGAAHVPPQQSCPPAHVVPHIPQFVALELVFTQRPPQQVCPPAHIVPQPPQFSSSLSVSTHVEAQHVSAAPVHARPQAPQLVSSVRVSMQAPPQQSKPVVHAIEQLPQCVRSVIRSYASSTRLSQSSSRESHASIGAGVGVMHSRREGVSVLHCLTPSAQTPGSEPMQLVESPAMSSGMSLQSSSSPWFAQVSATGPTAPMHGPHSVPSQVCVPSTHGPMPAVPGGPP